MPRKGGKQTMNGGYCIEKFWSGDITNRNGKMLLNLAEINKLKIANTYFKKKFRGKGHGCPQMGKLEMK